MSRRRFARWFRRFERQNRGRWAWRQVEEYLALLEVTRGEIQENAGAIGDLRSQAATVEARLEYAAGQNNERFGVATMGRDALLEKLDAYRDRLETMEQSLAHLGPHGRRQDESLGCALQDIEKLYGGAAEFEDRLNHLAEMIADAGVSFKGSDE